VPKNLNRCKIKFCRGYVLSNAHSSFCGKCRSRRFKEAHPLKYSFAHLRQRAKERGHAFTLTFADYEAFAIQTGYDKLKGKTKHSLSIHRKENHRGYEKDNISAVTLSLNSRLRFANMPDWLREEMHEAERASQQVSL
jgi:hypothetical protein